MHKSSEARTSKYVRVAQHSTAQSAMHKAAKHARECQSATTSASRKELARISMSSICSSLCSQIQRRNQNLPPGGNKKKTTATSSWWWCVKDLPLFPISIRRDYIRFSLSDKFWYDACMRRLGCFPGARSSWHSQVVSLHLKSWTSYVRFIRIVFVFHYFLVSTSLNSGGNPSAERSAS